MATNGRPMTIKPERAFGGRTRGSEEFAKVLRHLFADNQRPTPRHLADEEALLALDSTKRVKQLQREQIAADVEAYLAKGKQIQRV